MSASQRTKGKVGEREVVEIFKAAGFSRARRQGDAGQDDRDIAHVPAYVEVRRREALRIPEWFKEVTAECPDGVLPVIATRRSGEEWMAVVPLSDLFGMLAALHLPEGKQ